MKPSCIYLIMIIFTKCFSAQGQEVKQYFDRLATVLESEKSSTIFLRKLDSLKSNFAASRSSISNYFDRDVDFYFRHQRINVEFNFRRFQIDILKKRDTIYVTSIISEDDKRLVFVKVDTSQAKVYLVNRNKFYRSSKTVKDLIKDLSSEEVFAFYCGDGDPKTKRGEYIEKLVETENIFALSNMLKSICVETQAYGVSGFTMLEKHDFNIPYDIQKIIKRIKIRNSETVICSGCLTGLIQKIYNKY